LRWLLRRELRRLLCVTSSEAVARTRAVQPLQQAALREVHELRAAQAADPVGEPMNACTNVSAARPMLRDLRSSGAARCARWLGVALTSTTFACGRKGTLLPASRAKPSPQRRCRYS
jgi:hypothetical protein